MRTSTPPLPETDPDGDARPADAERKQATPPLYGADPDRSRRCLCCLQLRADASFDYHHWAYRSEDGFDVGLYLCRACHTAVHGGWRVSVQRRRSHTSDWRDDALARLIARHRAVWGRPPPGGLAEWYNIPCDRGRILRAIPRSFDPVVLDTAVPDDELSGAGAGAGADADAQDAGDETDGETSGGTDADDDETEDAETRRLPTPNP